MEVARYWRNKWTLNPLTGFGGSFYPRANVHERGDTTFAERALPSECVAREQAIERKKNESVPDQANAIRALLDARNEWEALQATQRVVLRELAIYESVG